MKGIRTMVSLLPVLVIVGSVNPSVCMGWATHYSIVKKVEDKNELPKQVQSQQRQARQTLY